MKLSRESVEQADNSGLSEQRQMPTLVFSPSNDEELIGDSQREVVSTGRVSKPDVSNS